MKKIICSILVFLLCVTLVGCKNDFLSPSETQPGSDPDETKEEAKTETFDTPMTIGATITEKIGSDTLVVQTSSSRFVEKFGSTAYIVTFRADQFCVGDVVEITFTSVQYPTEEIPHVTIFTNGIHNFADMPVYKPIIYLYPTAPTVVSVKVDLNGKLTCTYPSHGEEGWQNFTAYPDGTLISPDGKEYYALYWEGVQNATWDFSQGWCVRGEDTAEFLEWALAQQGLTPREANEFIVYWLPLMQENPYNVISFQTTAYTDAAALEISPAPDSLLRVFMAYYASDVAVDIAPQTFEGFTREGFTVVEWGGSNVTNP